MISGSFTERTWVDSSPGLVLNKSSRGTHLSCSLYHQLQHIKTVLPSIVWVRHRTYLVYIVVGALSPFHTNWRCTGDQQFWTHRQCIARRRQTTSVHCQHIASARQPSSTLRQAWRFFWNVQKNRQASQTVASEYSVVKRLSALRQPSPSYSSSSPMRR